MADTPMERLGDLTASTLTRRRLLINAGVLAGGAMLAGPLAACGTSSPNAAGGSPKRGGNFRLGVTGGGSGDIIDGQKIVTKPDQARLVAGFETLLEYDTNYKLQTTGLAESVTQDAPDKWTIKLKSGITFHNGKPLTAEDVIYSISLMAKPTSAAAPFVSSISLRDLKAINDTTLRIKLGSPDADLAANFAYYNTWIVQSGEKDFSKPVGTGPFKFESFTPGKQSIFTKNPDYWISGKPHVDSLKIVGISDNAARLNALLSGQIDAMAFLPTAQAKAHKASGDINVLDAPSPQAVMFYMDTTKPPFNDNNVRLAMRLIADRQALIDGALSGYGRLGNDIVGKDLPLYDDSLPQRTQDIEQAKSLLKKAGQENLTVQLDTSEIITGFVEAATLLAEQAKDAGVTIQLKQVPPNSYYNPSLLYLKMAFAETQWPPPSLKFFYLQALSSTAPYNETHWKNKAWNALLQQAIGELDEAKAQTLWNQVQEIQYNEGGYLNWTNADWVDGISNKVKGLEPHPAGVLGNYLFLNAWLAA